MKNIVIALFCFCLQGLFAQEKISPGRFTAGVELDVLPYATGGYFGAVWAGKGHWRGRLIVAKATKPDFLLPDQFSDNTIKAYALLADYFLRPDFSGWWVAGGIVYWDARIRYNPAESSGAYKIYLASIGGGYNWKFFRNFYLSPWAGIHLRIAGDKEVLFQGDTYEPPLFNPEGSLKLGWHF